MYYSRAMIRGVNKNIFAERGSIHILYAIQVESAPLCLRVPLKILTNSFLYNSLLFFPPVYRPPPILSFFFLDRSSTLLEPPSNRVSFVVLRSGVSSVFFVSVVGCRLLPPRGKRYLVPTKFLLCPPPPPE